MPGSLKRILRCSAVVLLLFAHEASAAVGRIYYTSGGVYVERGTQRIPAAVGEVLETGDTVVTERDGRVQWRLADDSYFALRPNTRYQIEDFSFSGRSQDAASGRSFLRLVAGGFRTLTGLIGKPNASNYELRTPVATLGVRGTDYTQIFCGDCSWIEAKGFKVKSGLYVRVDVGAVEIKNSAGSLNVSAGQYAYVEADSIVPVLVPEAPPVFLTWEVDFEWFFPDPRDLVDRLPRIEPIDEPCLPVPSPNTPCPP